MSRQIQSSLTWLLLILAGVVVVFGFEIDDVDNVRITYTETDNDMPIEWFGLALEETPSNLSQDAIDAVIRAVNLMAQDEMYDKYDNTDYMFGGIILETVMDPETLVFKQSATKKGNRKLRRAFELDQHGESRDYEDEMLPQRKFRKVAEEKVEVEDAEYLKRTRQVVEDTYGTYLVLGGTYTFMQLPTPPADEVNNYMMDILSDTTKLMVYLENQNAQELNMLTTVIVTMPLPSNSPSMVPSNTPTASQSPSSSPTPVPTLSPTPPTVVSPTPPTTLSPTPLTVVPPTSAPTLSPTPLPTLSPTPLTVVPPTSAPTLSPTPSSVVSPTSATTLSPTSATIVTEPPVAINKGIQNDPEPAGTNTRSMNILIVAVASCSAAFIALSSALLVRRRYGSADPEDETKDVEGGIDDFDDGTLKRRNKGFSLKDDELNSSFGSSEMNRSSITRVTSSDTPKASGRTSRNPYVSPSPDHSNIYANNSSDYHTAGSSNTSFSYSAGMQMREAELDAQNRSKSGIMADSIDEGYPSPPLSSGSSPLSNYHPARDEFEDHVNDHAIIDYSTNVVGIAPTPQGIEVTALPTGSYSPRIMASWGSWLFGTNNKDSNNNNNNNNNSSNQKSKQENDVGAFPRATEDDFFQAEFTDSHQVKKKSYVRNPPRVLEHSFPSDTNRSNDQENFQSFSDGSFPTFGMEDHAPPIRPTSTRSRMSKNASSAAGSSSREDSSSAAYTMHDLHPLDWSNKGSENGDDDSSLTEHDGPSDAEGQMIYKQYLDRERRRRGGNPSRHTAQEYPTTPQSENSAYFSVQSEQSSVSHASSSKQLINDLVWLEKKISDVRERVDRLDEDNDLDSSSSVDSFMASNASTRSSNGGGKSPISHSIICRDCFAPPGRLQIIIHSTRDGPSVHSVKPGSSLEGKLFPGDLILAVDDIDTRRQSAEDVMKMMAAKSAYERKITVLHFDDRSFQM